MICRYEVVGYWYPARSGSDAFGVRWNSPVRHRSVTGHLHSDSWTGSQRPEALAIDIEMKRKLEKERESFPADLGELVGEEALVHLVLNAVQIASEQPESGISSCSSDESPNARMMISLLTYCYARNLFGSQEIEEQTTAPSMVRYLCAREFPEFDALRNFRRRHRKILTECLRRVVSGVDRIRCDNQETLPARSRGPVHSNELLCEATEEADRRIQLAAQADSILLDE